MVLVVGFYLVVDLMVYVLFVVMVKFGLIILDVVIGVLLFWNWCVSMVMLIVEVLGFVGILVVVIMNWYLMFLEEMLFVLFGFVKGIVSLLFERVGLGNVCIG